MTACSGFTAANLITVSFSGTGGFSAAQIGAIGREGACAGLAYGQFDAVKPASYAGFTKLCISSIRGSSAGGMTREGISYLSNDACTGLTEDQMRNINPEPYGGFSPACISSLSASGCKGIAPKGLPQWTTQGFAALTAVCISNTGTWAWKDVTTAQAAALTPASCAGFEAWNLPHAGVKALAGITAACVSYFKNGTCYGLDDLQAEALAPAAYAGFTRSCIESARLTFFALVSSVQIGQLNPAACAGLKPGQLDDMPAGAYAGFQKACVSNLGFRGGHDACSALTAEGIAQMSPEAFSGLSPNCVQRFSVGQTAAITPAQIQALPAASCSGFEFLSAMQPATFSAMSLQQILPLSVYGVQSLTSAQLVELLGKWKNEILLSDDGWSQAQTYAPTDTQVAGVRAAINEGQLQRFVPLPTDWNAFAQKINWLHMILFVSNPTPSGWDSSIITALAAGGPPTPSSFSGFTSYHVAHLNSTGAASITEREASFFQSEAVTALTPAQWAALSGSSIGGFRGSSWQNITCQACITGLTPVQVSQIAVWALIPCPTVGLFALTQSSAMDPVHLSTFNDRRAECGQTQTAPSAPAPIWMPAPSGGVTPPVESHTPLAAPPVFVSSPFISEHSPAGGATPPVSPPSVPPPSDHEIHGDTPSAPQNNNFVIGITVGVVLGAAVIVAAIVGFVKWRAGISTRRGYTLL